MIRTMKEILIGCILMFTLVSCTPQNINKLNDEPLQNITFEKPVIYLYPQEKTKINIELEFDGELTFTYPEYKNSWQVIADPNGNIYTEDGKEYSYLFWEGRSDYSWEINEGFVVEGSNTVEFLQNTLEEMGLIPKEYNDFIVYWAPLMQENKYNLIHFAGEEYEALAKLSIEPKPDEILRVFMVYQALEEPVTVKKQQLKPFERKGFTVIEWGGAMIGH
ncbi:hypothetical protein EDC19_1183 [Natranaerovirga hydrolytica]|uniref:Uncharacterized protein n=1 Tax=Natranaerovirga hydrolytica TaxID=680378 RepID=A0A4R1MZH7_9FIRM|nr:hypothetical protein [Natranaerovirga hydrolytica]TCK98748.1 hypothetical protein EDC19_1183 [Natranaerovirga hydrolytica]